MTAQASLAPYPSTGIQKHSRLAASSGTEKKRRNGRNLPHRVMVRSTSRPASRSAKASQILTNRKMLPASTGSMPTTSV